MATFVLHTQAARMQQAVPAAAAATLALTRARGWLGGWPGSPDTVLCGYT